MATIVNCSWVVAGPKRTSDYTLVSLQGPAAALSSRRKHKLQGSRYLRYRVHAWSPKTGVLFGNFGIGCIL